MDNKVKCIICGKTRTGTVEHIIPEALGNKTLKIHNVCKECNSRLGQNIDSKLTDNFLVVLIRNTLGLKGYKGNIPNIFNRGVDQDGNIVISDKKSKLCYAPKVSFNDDILRVEASSLKEALNISETKLKRMGYSNEKIAELNQKANIEIHDTYPKIFYTNEIDLNSLKLAALKIAYEYAIFRFGDLYYYDPIASKIRTILFNASRGLEYTQYDKMGLSPSEITRHLKYNKYHNKHHMLIIHCDGVNQLIIEVILFFEPALSFCICVSENASNYEFTNADFKIIDVIS
jgi:hypothetical protein